MKKENLKFIFTVNIKIIEDTNINKKFQICKRIFSYSQDDFFLFF